jgi:hypothetical protein
MSVRNRCCYFIRTSRYANGVLVEVAPVYDNVGETTVLAAAEIALSLIGLMVKKPVQALK